MAHLGYNNEDFLNLVIIYGECNRIISRTCQLFAERYPEKRRPSRKTVRNIINNLLEYGSFQSKVERRKPKVDNEELEITVLAFFRAFPNASLRDAEISLRESFKTIHRILLKHKWKPFSYTLVQHLKPTDLPRRIEFCEWMLINIQENPDFLKHIIWCDEAKFSKNGMFNRHNSHFWSDENPHLAHERSFQDSFSFNVFCAIKYDRIFSLVFYDDNLNGEWYLNILRNAVVPALNTLPNNVRDAAWYQQDGAGPHNYIPVGVLLTDLFEDRWIANKGPFHWPPRSPDLNPLDFSIWGYIKNAVYANPVTTKEDLQNRIRQAFQSLDPATLIKITQENLLKRINKCLEVNGDVFEHIL